VNTPTSTSELLEAELDEDHTSSSAWGPFVLGATMLVIGGVALKETLAVRGEGFAPEGPRFFPLVVTVAWIALSMAYLAQQARVALRERSSLPAERFDHRLGLVVLVAMMVGYAYVLVPLGYVVTTSIFFVAAARTMGSRVLVRDAVVGIGLSLGVYLLFTGALGVSLPAGVLPL
jgi:putative tricarboxylic transport membrane protein